MCSRSDHCLSLVLFLQEAGSAEDDRRSQPRRYVHRPDSNLFCSSTSILKYTFMSQIFIATLDWTIFVFEENIHFSFDPSYDMQYLHQGEYSDQCMTNERNRVWVFINVCFIFRMGNCIFDLLVLVFRLCNNKYLCLRKKLKIWN